MPCRYDTSPEEEAAAAKATREHEQAQQEKLDKLTRLLCEACQAIPEIRECSDELVGWWMKHQEADKKRK